VLAEPFAGHFGIGGLPGGQTLLGMFFKRQKDRRHLQRRDRWISPGATSLLKVPLSYVSACAS
jgi:hypothetical protein